MVNSTIKVIGRPVYYLGWGRVLVYFIQSTFMWFMPSNTCIYSILMFQKWCLQNLILNRTIQKLYIICFLQEGMGSYVLFFAIV